MSKIAWFEGFCCCRTTSAVVQDDSSFLPQQIIQIAQFFSTGLFAHSKMYHFLFTQPQPHDEQNVMLQVIMHSLVVQTDGRNLGLANVCYIAHCYCKFLQMGVVEGETSKLACAACLLSYVSKSWQPALVPCSFSHRTDFCRTSTSHAAML